MNPSVPVSTSPEQQRYRVTRRVTVVGAVVNLLLSVLKIAVGVIAQSEALIADGVHSLSDLISDGVVLVASKQSSREPDPQHPYGHGRIETLATVIIGILLFAVTLGLLWDAGRRLLAPETLLQPGPLALAAAVISVAANEALTQYTLAAARRVRSSLLRANAWHHRSDAISSVVVIIGVGGAMAGLPYLDAVAAIFVALMIARIAWDLCWGGARELIDTGLDPEEVARMREVILSVHGVEALHMLRSRRMGAEALVDVHILVDPKLSVSEGHQISETVRAALVRKLEDVADVTVHIDPEDDEINAPNAGLPLRPRVLADIRQALAGLPERTAVEQIILHYLEGRIEVEATLPIRLAEQPEAREALRAELRRRIEALDYVSRLRVKFH